MMSMLGVAFLEEVTHTRAELNAARILDDLTAHIIHSLNQAEQEVIKDGMDMGLCVLDLADKQLQFAGANNSMYLLRQGKTVPKKGQMFKEQQEVDTEPEVKGIEFEADKMPVGISYNQDQPFTNYELSLQKGDTIYLYSDGYPDQFGGPDNKKFSYPRFRQTLLDIYSSSMPEQKETLHNTLKEWQGEQEQVDDICVLGVRVG
jgi:serine phosphatase RsbU (regulator of sigma subunit)